MTQAAPDPVLELDDVTMRFGGVVALSEANLTVHDGEIFALIGPNGAGKTTVFNVVTGVFRPTTGQVLFAGSRIDGMKRFRVTKAGIARTFQNIRLFHNMTALENVLVGTDAHHRTGAIGAALGLPWHRTEEREGRERAVELLDFVGISGRSDEAAKNLPYGDQRRLEIARALATNPRLLLLDEPASGLSEEQRQRLAALLTTLAERTCVLLVEHDLALVAQVSERIFVLSGGHLVFDGGPEDFRSSPVVNSLLVGS